MSTYLELCQFTREECRIPGSSVPSAVTGQTGVLSRICRWVSQSYSEIQNRRPSWRWLRHEFTVDTVESTSSYAYGDCTDSDTSSAITRFRRWRINDLDDPLKCYLTDTGVGAEYWLSYIPWNHFQAIYRLGTQTDSNPSHCSIDPQNNLVIGPAPNDVYTLTGNYVRAAQVLAADGDEPEMPEDFHYLIVYMAMQKYGLTEGAAEILTRGQTEGNKLMRQLELDQLDEIFLAGALA